MREVRERVAIIDALARRCSAARPLFALFERGFVGLWRRRRRTAAHGNDAGNERHQRGERNREPGLSEEKKHRAYQAQTAGAINGRLATAWARRVRMSRLSGAWRGRSITSTNAIAN